MELKKYNNTTFNGIVVTEVKLHKDFDGSATIELLNNNDILYTTPLWLWYEDIKDYSADYLLCDIQDTTGLEVLK